MFWKLKIPISREIYGTSKHAIYAARCLGLLPMIVQKERRQLFLKFSPMFAVYSFFIGTVLVTLMYRGFFEDVLIGKNKSVAIKTESDTFIKFFEITITVWLIFLGIFVAPFKYSTFVKFVECFSKVDNVTFPKQIKSARNLSIFTLTVVLVLIICASITDMLANFNNNSSKDHVLEVALFYTPLYIGNFVLYVYQFIIWHLIFCILRRIKLLNEHLKTKNPTRITVFPSSLAVATISTTLSKLQVKVKDVDHDKVSINQNINNRHKGSRSLNIGNLAQVYGKLCDAVECLNLLVGTNIVIILVGILWHLILTPYSAIMILTKSNQEVTSILTHVMWCCIHLARLWFFVQPCHACELEVQKTKSMVFELSASPNIYEKVKAELRDFSAILELRTFQFTANGLITIDRSLIARMIGVATTYLVVILQVPLEDHPST